MYRGIPSSVIMLLHAQIFGCTQILKMPNSLNPLILGRDHKKLYLSFICLVLRGSYSAGGGQQRQSLDESQIDRIAVIVVDVHFPCADRKNRRHR